MSGTSLRDLLGVRPTTDQFPQLRRLHSMVAALEAAGLISCQEPVGGVGEGLPRWLFGNGESPVSEAGAGENSTRHA